MGLRKGDRTVAQKKIEILISLFTKNKSNPKQSKPNSIQKTPNNNFQEQDVNQRNQH
jgi:hypothetical protein